MNLASISICSVQRGHTRYRSCSALRAGFYLGINPHLHVILFLLCTCCRLHLLDRTGKNKQNSFNQRIFLDFHPVPFKSVVKTVNWDQLRCRSGCLPAQSPLGFSSALRSSLHPEHCLPVCTHSRLIWPGTLTSCQTHREKACTAVVFWAEAGVKIWITFLAKNNEPPARWKTKSVKCLCVHLRTKCAFSMRRNKGLGRRHNYGDQAVTIAAD